MPSMHRYSDETEQLANDIMRVALDRLRMDVPLDGPQTPESLAQRAGDTITAAGLGGDAALRLWTDVLAPATMSVDHPRYVSFIPGAPTEASTLFDLLVGASSLYGGIVARGLRRGLRREPGAALGRRPRRASRRKRAAASLRAARVGNLSALVAARHAASAATRAGEPPGRWKVVACTGETHSSIGSRARAVMDVDLLPVATDERGRHDRGRAARGARRPPTPTACSPWWQQRARPTPASSTTWTAIADVVRRRARSGSTSTAPTAAPRWRAPSVRDLFARHRARRLVHRRPAQVAVRAVRLLRPAVPRAGAGPRAPTRSTPATSTRSPSRERVESVRLRRTPVAPGARAAVLVLARHARHRRLPRGDRGDARRGPGGAPRHPPPPTTSSCCVEPDLSVVVFRRIGWTPDAVLRLVATGCWPGNFAFVTPDRRTDGETVTRFAIVNPRTTVIGRHRASSTRWRSRRPPHTRSVDFVAWQLPRLSRRSASS